MKRALAWLAGLAGVACILHALACDDQGSHLYLGYFYVEDRDCVGTTSVVDVVSGGDPGTCAPVCLVGKEDGARAVYVSPMCGPFPKFFDTSGSDPACARAIAALSRQDSCLSDGGSTNRAPQSDAADAGAD